MSLDFIYKPLTSLDPPLFRVVSTFSGCGGSSLGYIWAGGKVLLAVEWDKNAIETYRLNFPDTPVFHGDIAALPVEAVLEQTGLRVGELDILDGSPPCQGFSTVGKRQFTDERNQLFREYVRLLRGLQPKVFVMENVSGLIKGKMKLIFADIMRELKASGYRVSARLLNAMYFGVPQSRERLIFIGVREDLGILPSHPLAQGKPITVKEAFEDVPYEDAPYLSPKLASLISKIPYYGDGGDIGNSHFSTKRLAWEYPSRTIIKGNVGSHACFIHPDGKRAITLAELRRISSFPDSFQLAGGYKKGFERIGNSVPPLFMQAIAEHIYQVALAPELIPHA